MVQNFPDESEMLVLGAERLDSDHQEGFWRYRFHDGNQIELFLSFDVIEGSIQTLLKFLGKDAMITSHENLVSIFIENEKRICADFDVPSQKVSLEIDLIPEIKVKWSALCI